MEAMELLIHFPRLPLYFVTMFFFPSVCTDTDTDISPPPISSSCVNLWAVEVEGSSLELNKRDGPRALSSYYTYT
jgi:hypothetical protein